jgi:hypothetical protein
MRRSSVSIADRRTGRVQLGDRRRESPRPLARRDWHQDTGQLIFSRDDRMQLIADFQFVAASRPQRHLVVFMGQPLDSRAGQAAGPAGVRLAKNIAT